MTKLYPHPYRSFATREEAIVYALEVQGYYDLLESIWWWCELGLITAN